MQFGRDNLRGFAAPLALLKFRVALEMLFERFSRINWFDDHLQFRKGTVLRVLQYLVMKRNSASVATFFVNRQCAHYAVNVALQWEIQFVLTPAISMYTIKVVQSGNTRGPSSSETLGYGLVERP